jgi:hypothetical protein
MRSIQSSVTRETQVPVRSTGAAARAPVAGATLGTTALALRENNQRNSHEDRRKNQRSQRRLTPSSHLRHDSSNQLLNVPGPFPRGSLLRGWTGCPADQKLLFREIARRRAINDQKISNLQREAIHATLRQLRDAAPFTAPADDRAVFLLHFERDERMRIADIEFFTVPSIRMSLSSM